MPTNQHHSHGTHSSQQNKPPDNVHSSQKQDLAPDRQSVMHQSETLYDERLPLVQRQRQALNLNRVLGNRRVQRFLQKSAHSVQRFWSDPLTAQEIIDSGDSDNINWSNMDNIRKGTVSQRLQMIRMVHGNTWVGSNDEYLLEAIWNSLGAKRIVENVDLFKQSMDRGIEINNIESLRSVYVVHQPNDVIAGVIKLVLRLGWVGPFDEWYLENLWSGMDDEGLSKNLTLLKDSVEHGVNLDNIKRIKKLKENFKSDTKALADGYLKSNQEMVTEEKKKLGIGEDTMAAQGEPNEREAARLKEIQEAGAMMHAASLAMKSLREVQVGWRPKTATLPEAALTGLMPAHTAPFRRPPDYFAAYNMAEGTYSQARPIEPHYFKDGEPPLDHNHRPSEKIAEYPFVKGLYDSCQSFVDGLTKRYPGLYTLAAEDRLGELAQKESPAQIRSMMSGALNELGENIHNTREDLNEDDLDWQELKPIHAQLQGGKPSASKTDWSTNIAKFVMAAELEGYEDSQFWVTMGLTTLGAAAFVIAELATFGTATFWLAAAVGMGAGITQAGMSIEKYLDLAQAHESTVSRDTQLVAEGQVDAAAIAAVLDTAFVFLDALGPLSQGAKAGWKTAKTAVDVMPVDAAARGVGAAIEKDLLKRLPSLTATNLGREGIQTLEEGITKFGIEKVSKLTGLSSSDMLSVMEVMAKDSPITARLRQFLAMQPVSPKQLAKYRNSLANIGDDIAKNRLTAQQADQIVSTLIEELGPMEVIKRSGGWKVLNNPKVLGKSSIAGQKLEAWRQSLVKEVNDYIAKEFRGNVKATGTPGHLSDLDTSQLGRAQGPVTGLEAAAHREKAVSFLAGRLDVVPAQLNKLLDTDLFVDPRRIHLYDQVFAAMPKLRSSAAQKAAAFEQELIYNLRYKNALKNNKKLAAQILEEMQELGIKQLDSIPHLTPEMTVQLNRQIDDLTAQLAEVMERGDLAEAERLVLEISNKQAMINAAETGGYFSGGGVRGLVSERDAFPGYNPFKHQGTGAILGEMAGREMHKGQMFTGMLDQMLKLDKYASELTQKGAQEIKDLPGVLKNIGKYGQRFQEIALRANMGKPIKNLKQILALGDEFGAIMSGAKTLPSDPAAAKIVLEELSERAHKALNNLNASHMDLLKEVQQAAGLHGMSAAGEAYATLSRAHLMWLSAKDEVDQLIIKFVSQYVQEGLQAGAQNLAE